MQKLILLLIILSLVSKVKSQCPDNAAGVFATYIRLVDMGPNGPVSDTSLWLDAMNFNPNTKVYFYDHNNILVDSVTTAANGYGTVSIRPSYIDSMCDSLFGNCGTATNGICSVPIREMGLLPLKLLSFHLVNSYDYITLGWQVTGEDAGTKFVIQESMDGVNFKDLHLQVAALTNNGTYSYTIPSAIKQNKYFRIKIMSISGTIVYSETRIATSSAASSDIQISSSPAGILVSVGKDFLKGEYAVFNAAGILLEKKKIMNTWFSIAQQLNKGVYYIRLTDIKGNRRGRSFLSF